MGRLTLNILLSFAQFEREIIGERIRDKKLATARQGKYIGGQPVLGLDIIDKRNTSSIAPRPNWFGGCFEMFLELESCRKVAEALNAEGLVTKKYRTKTGKRLWRQAVEGAGRLRSADLTESHIGQIVHKGQGLSRRARGDREDRFI